MEELLNNLIKKGRKPFGWDDKLSSFHKEYGVGKWYIRFHNGMDSESFDLRQLTSKESGLWQFVCENRMVNLEYDITKSYKDSRDRVHHGGYNGDRYLEGFDMYNYKYRIIESALCNEEDLEKFLLDNIQLGK